MGKLEMYCDKYSKESKCEEIKQIGDMYLCDTHKRVVNNVEDLKKYYQITKNKIEKFIELNDEEIRNLYDAVNGKAFYDCICKCNNYIKIIEDHMAKGSGYDGIVNCMIYLLIKEFERLKNNIKFSILDEGDEND